MGEADSDRTPNLIARTGSLGHVWQLEITPIYDKLQSLDIGHIDRSAHLPFTFDQSRNAADHRILNARREKRGEESNLFASDAHRPLAAANCLRSAPIPQ